SFEFLPLPFSFFPRRPPPLTPLFPYTTLFRSAARGRRRRDGLQLSGLDRDRLEGRSGLDLRTTEVHRVAADERLCSRGRHREHQDRKSTRLNSSHDQISYAVFCLKKKNT